MEQNCQQEKRKQEFFLPEIITFAQYQIGFGEQCGANFAQATITAGTFEAIFMPILIQCLQQESFFNWLMTLKTFDRHQRLQCGRTRHLFMLIAGHHFNVWPKKNVDVGAEFNSNRTEQIELNWISKQNKWKQKPPAPFTNDEFKKWLITNLNPV